MSAQLMRGAWARCPRSLPALVAADFYTPEAARPPSAAPLLPQMGSPVGVISDKVLL